MYGKVKDTYLIFWWLDRAPWEIKRVDFPLFTESKFVGDKFILIPDATFDTLSLQSKYGVDKAYNWDELKNKIIRYEPKKQLNDIYFKGTDTGMKRNKLRHFMQKYQNGKVVVKLDTWQKYEPLYAWKEHGALLNLPGHYDWSNRFKYLFLLNKPIINVDVDLMEAEGIDRKTITYIDYYVKPNVDYINIKVDLDYILLNENSESKNEKNTKDLIRRLNNLDIKNDKTHISGYNKIKQLELKHVYKYIHSIISYISEEFTYIL